VGYLVILETTATKSVGLLELLRQIAEGVNDSPNWFDVWGPVILGSIITALVVTATTFCTIAHQKNKETKTHLLADIRLISQKSSELFMEITKSNSNSRKKKKNVKKVLSELSAQLSAAIFVNTVIPITYTFLFRYNKEVIDNSSASQWLITKFSTPQDNYPYHYYGSLLSILNNLLLLSPQDIKKRARYENDCFDSYEKYENIQGSEPDIMLLEKARKSLHNLQPYTFKVIPPKKTKKQLRDDCKIVRAAIGRWWRTIKRYLA